MLSEEQIFRILLSEKNERIAAEKIHDLCKPDHTIHVAAAAMENEVTDTLIDMLVVTVLAKLIDQEGGGRTNFAFSPMDMAAVMKEWDYTVEREGLVRTVRIQPKDGVEWEEGDGDLLQASSLARAMSRANEDTEIAPPPPITDLDSVSPQAAPHVYNRPTWAVRFWCAADEGFEPGLKECADRGEAMRVLRGYHDDDGRPDATIENRWCEHIECPSTGCTHDASKRDDAEATSD